MRLLNTYVNNVTLDEAVEFLLQKIREQTPAYVVEVNVDVVVKMETDPVLRQITDNADLTLVDGQPLIWISKLYGRPLKMKVSGSDLVPTLLQAAARKAALSLCWAEKKTRPARQQKTSRPVIRVW